MDFKSRGNIICDGNSESGRSRAVMSFIYKKLHQDLGINIFELSFT